VVYGLVVAVLVLVLADVVFVAVERKEGTVRDHPAARVRQPPPRGRGRRVTSVRVAGEVHDFLLPDSLRDTRAADVARHLAIDVLGEALHDT